MKVITFLIACLLTAAPAPLRAAEYEGKNIDGQSFNCTAFRVGSKRYYYGRVVFSGIEATFYYMDKPFLTVSLDEETIEDPHDVPAYDYENAIAWNLNVHNLE